MRPSAGGACRRERRLSDSSPFHSFRRARQQLWILSVLGVVLGAVLHAWAARSLGARLFWLGAVATSLARPWRRLLAFRCPRCGAVFLATGGWRDFLGLTRILWGKQCGSCALSVMEKEPPSSRALPESGPI